MRQAPAIIHALGLIVLFVAYVASGPTDRPAGVRRALQTFDMQAPSTRMPGFRPGRDLAVTTHTGE